MTSGCYQAPPCDAKPCKPMWLEAVTVCVNYSDFLAWSLLWNARHFDRLVVVTTAQDRATRDLCEHHHIECVTTDAFYRGGLAFCKGGGINAGLARLGLSDWCVHLDSDIILPPRTRQLIEAAQLDPTMLYGVDRLMCQSFEDWTAYCVQPEVQHSVNAFVQARAFPLGARVANMGKGQDGYIPIGFFQLWNPGATGIRTYPDHCDAGRGDMAFAKQWRRACRHLLPEVVAIHLESEASDMAVNWRGRQTRAFGPAPIPAPRALVR